MDNQQLNPKQGRVQRSSRKRVLDLKQFIIWETPCIKNKIYIYTLFSSKDNIICKGLRKHVSKLNFKYYEDMIQPLEKS